MEFIHEDTGTRFTVIKPTVLQQLGYYDKIGQTFEQRWAATRLLIDEWECEFMPDKNADLGKLDDGRITRVILWAIGRVADYFNGLGAVEKNN